MTQSLRDRVIRGMEEGLHVRAVLGHEATHGKKPRGAELATIAGPPTPRARAAARQLASQIEAANELELDALLVRAVEVDGQPEAEGRNAAVFGASLVDMALGQGRSWFADHEPFPLEVPPARFTYASRAAYRTTAEQEALAQLHAGAADRLHLLAVRDHQRDQGRILGGAALLQIAGPRSPRAEHAAAELLEWTEHRHGASMTRLLALAPATSPYEHGARLASAARGEGRAFAVPPLVRFRYRTPAHYHAPEAIYANPTPDPAELANARALIEHRALTQIRRHIHGAEDKLSRLRIRPEEGPPPEPGPPPPAPPPEEAPPPSGERARIAPPPAAAPSPAPSPSPAPPPVSATAPRDVPTPLAPEPPPPPARPPLVLVPPVPEVVAKSPLEPATPGPEAPVIAPAPVQPFAQGRGDVHLVVHGPGRVEVQVPAYLGGPKFEAFRSATDEAGVKNEKPPPGSRNWLRTIPTERVPTLTRALQKRGLTVSADAGVRDAVVGSAEKISAAIAAGNERLASADRALAPTGRSLRPYQREGVRWLCSRLSGALLADDMGLGKTAQALIALPDKARVIVICPAVAKGVWRREIQKWRPELRATLLSGRGALTRWPEPGEVLITNYDILPDEPPKGAAPEEIVLICDEAHAVKNKEAARSQKVRSLSETIQARRGRVWLITATPLTNNPPELWAVLSAAGLQNEAFGTWGTFAYLFGGRKTRYGMDWGTPSSAVPEKLRRVMLRRDKLDVAKELPPKSRQIVEVELDRESLRKLEAEIKALLKEGTDIDDLFDAIESGSVAFEQLSRLRAALATAKIPAALAMAEDYEEHGEPVVVFSAHRAVVDLLGKRPGWGRISGDETAEQKTKIEEAFQSGKLKGIAATIKAGGVAITLTRAAHAVFVDQAWTPADNVQAEDRIFRIGQTRACLIQILQADHAVDARVAELLLKKIALYEGSVGAARLQEGEVQIAGPGEAVTFDEGTIAAAGAAQGRPVTRARRLYYRGETNAAPDTGEPRPAQTEAEHWALRGLETLSDLDPDRAREQNGVGFNKADGEYGRRLAAAMRFEGLTDRGWKAARDLLRKYHGQVGKEPREPKEAKTG